MYRWACALSWLALFTSYGSPASAQTLCALEEARVEGREPMDSDQFGYTVEIEGPLAVIGAWQADLRGQTNAGKAYVFRNLGTAWTRETQLSASNPGPNDQFGFAAATDGTRVIVGSRFNDAVATDAGAAYVYQVLGTAWTEVQPLFSSSAHASDFFGNAVDIDGATLVVGAVGESDSSGSVHVFVHDGLQWIKQQQITPADNALGDEFGNAVSLDGDVLAVGARYEGDAVSEIGAVYVFERSGTVWSQTAKLTPPDGEDGDEFANDVAVNGDWIVAGAPCDDDGGASSGSVYAFQRSGTTWGFSSKLIGHNTVAYDQFGLSVSLGGDALVIGAFGRDDIGSDAGAAYLFRREGTSFVELSMLFASDGAADDLFGETVACDGTHAVIGSRLDDEGAVNAGSAYLFRLLPSPSTYCTGKTNSLGCVPFLTTTGKPSLTANAFNIVGNDVEANRIGFAIYSLKKANLAFHGGKLCVKAPIQRALPAKVSQDTGAPPCTGEIRLNFNKRIQSGVDPELTAGQTVYAQITLRDSSDPAGFGDSLTNAVSFAICP